MVIPVTFSSLLRIYLCKQSTSLLHIDNHIQKGDAEMKNNDNNNILEAQRLSDKEIEAVSGGVKVVVKNEKSWYRTLVDFFFS